MTTSECLQIGAYCQPLPGEPVSGDLADSWCVEPGVWLICLIDGLGHGPLAHQAARACRNCIEDARSEDLQSIFSRCNRGIRDTRGVALSLALIDTHKCQLQYAALGNINACVVSNRVQRLVNDYGIVGAEHSLEVSLSYLPFIPGQHSLVMISDGLEACLNLDDLTCQARSDADQWARQLVLRHASGRDDASAIVVR